MVINVFAEVRKNIMLFVLYVIGTCAAYYYYTPLQKYIIWIMIAAFAISMLFGNIIVPIATWFIPRAFTRSLNITMLSTAIFVGSTAVLIYKTYLVL